MPGKQLYWSTQRVEKEIPTFITLFKRAIVPGPQLAYLYPEVKWLTSCSWRMQSWLAWSPEDMCLKWVWGLRERWDMEMELDALPTTGRGCTIPLTAGMSKEAVPTCALPEKNWMLSQQPAGGQLHFLGLNNLGDTRRAHLLVEWRMPKWMPVCLTQLMSGSAWKWAHSLPQVKVHPVTFRSGGAARGQCRGHKGRVHQAFNVPFSGLRHFAEGQHCLAHCSGQII